MKTLLFCPFMKKIFENVLKFDLCHTSPFVFNSCITYFSFLPRLRNISSLFLNFVSGELPFFSVSSLFFFSSSFHSRFFVSLSCEIFHFVHFIIQKKTFSCFSLSFYSFIFFLSFFNPFFAFILSTLLLPWFFHGLPFFVRLKKTFTSHFLSPLPQFFSISLFPNCLIFVSSFHLLSLFSFSLRFFLSFFPSFFHYCHGIHGQRWLWNMCTDFQATECWCKNVPRDFCWTSTSPSLRIESASFNPAISASWCSFRSA